jgi:hypothetical protein
MGNMKVFLNHVDHIFFLPLVPHLPTCINLIAYDLSFHIIPCYLRMWDLCHCLALHSWVIVKVFHPSWYWFDLWFIMSCGLPSSVMWVDRSGSMSWFEQGLEWWRRLTLQVMWFVLLESTMVRLLGVDPLRQLVSPHVRYRTACLLIRIALGSVPCSVVRGRVQGVLIIHVVQERPWWGNLSKMGHTT